MFPEVVIAAEAFKNDGGTIPTEVTVPVPGAAGVDHVISATPPPWEVSTWPGEPGVVGRLKLYVPATG